MIGTVLYCDDSSHLLVVQTSIDEYCLISFHPPLKLYFGDELRGPWWPSNWRPLFDSALNAIDEADILDRFQTLQDACKAANSKQMAIQP